MRVKSSVRLTQLMWACSADAWNGEVCFSVAEVCRLVVVEDRVIPAERRGSCCFLLGIVSVTFLGASHAGITGESSLSVVKIHPARRCDGGLSSLSGTRRRLLFTPPALLRTGPDRLRQQGRNLRRDSAGSRHLRAHQRSSSFIFPSLAR